MGLRRIATVSTLSTAFLVKHVAMRVVNGVWYFSRATRPSRLQDVSFRSNCSENDMPQSPLPPVAPIFFPV